ncbi:unnamed protein product [Owenia fusiformis]|uniref:Uncharacterized protein n=1 Tax=Owenia fusiformis TaxID=6347 RepID=A0A8J1UTA6_OWEFU|nr:unnamed protein product [Owenia fusiformis]
MNRTERIMMTLQMHACFKVYGELSLGGVETLSNTSFTTMRSYNSTFATTTTDSITEVLTASLIRSGNSKETYQIVNRVIGYMLPIVLVFGFLGNILNLIILTRKRMKSNLDELEKSAHFGLIALAVSDMMFCISAFPLGFMNSQAGQPVLSETKHFMLYYKVFHTGIVNTFILMSTWLTVTMALARCIAVCYPLYARGVSSLQGVKISVSVVTVSCVLFTLPRFWTMKIREFSCSGGLKVYSPWPGDIVKLDGYTAYLLLWSFLGGIIPFILLLISNICLIRALHQSSRMRRMLSESTSANQSCSNAGCKLTPTFIAIVAVFLILVTPAEILKFVDEILKTRNGDRKMEFQIAEAVTNFLQSVNFTINFILYYIINIPFRKTMRELFTSQCQETYRAIHSRGSSMYRFSTPQTTDTQV